MLYLLDTNACIEYLRRRNAAIIRKILTTPATDIVLCSVVLAELFYGARRSRQAAQDLVKVERFVGLFRSFPFDDASAREFGRLQADLTARGLPIGPLDLQIAFIALINGLTLVTHNTREFSRVPGLNIEDWQPIP